MRKMRDLLRYYRCEVIAAVGTIALAGLVIFMFYYIMNNNWGAY